MANWWERPTILKEWPPEIQHIMFVDESGSPNLRAVNRHLREGTLLDIGEKVLVISGLIIARPDYPDVRKAIVELKNLYWPPDGQYFYQKKQENRRVCFHSEEIRKRQGPFAFSSNTTYNQFISDLSSLMVSSPYKLLSAGLDKLAHAQKYTTPLHPYNLCMNFILERFAKFILCPGDHRGIVILEARGGKEDHATLKNLLHLLSNGNAYVNAKTMQRITGIYFHPKWCCDSKNTKTYIGNELADLVSYPIHKFIREGIKDKAYCAIESKFDCYPSYMGRGLKTFP